MDLIIQIDVQSESSTREGDVFHGQEFYLSILIFCIIIYHLILEMILFNLVSCNYDHLIIYVDLIIEIDVESEQNL